jgi:mutator protein MutT
MKANECISFLLINDKNVLLERRSKNKKLDPGLIALPGGHIEAGENREQALNRELMEELNLVSESSAYLCSLYHPTTELQLIHYYVVSKWQGEMKVLEADEVAWFSIFDTPVEIEADKVALSEYRRLLSTQNVLF